MLESLTQDMLMKKNYHYQLLNQDLNLEDLHIFQIRLMFVMRLGGKIKTPIIVFLIKNLIQS